jgi:ribose transport system substrate-binding protein
MKRFLPMFLVIALGSAAFAQSSGTPVMKTLGPQGEEPTNYDKVVVGAKDTKAIAGKHLKAAILMHQSSDFSNALIAGAKAVFKELGINVVVVTDAEMDPNKQRTDIETALALKPDIIVTLVVDPVSGAVALQKAVDQGVKIVLISNLPNGFVHGRDYAGIVTDDLFGMGRSVAEMMGASLGNKGDVALLYHDANYYVTNQRDRAVKTVLGKQYPGIKIVTEKGIANPNDGEVAASAIITQNPSVKAIYAPWDTIAEGVVAATRSAGRKDIKVFTIDLGANTGLDLVKGGNMAGIVADLPYTMGETLARMGALSAIGVKTPPFVVVPAIKVDKSNIKDMWKKALNREAPKEILDALKK